MTRAFSLRCREALPVKALEKAMLKDCLEKRPAIHVKALGKAMTRATALKKGRLFMLKPWKRQWQGLLLENRASAAGQSLGKGNDKGFCLEQRQAIHAGQSLKGNDKSYVLKKT